MFASGYWYQYDSVVFEVLRFLGYIYLYENEIPQVRNYVKRSEDRKIGSENRIGF